MEPSALCSDEGLPPFGLNVTKVGTSPFVPNAGWTSDDWINFQAAISDIDNVHIIVMNSTSDLTNYINYRRTDGLYTDYEGNITNYRSGDEIKKFVVFSHGSKGKLMLGFDYFSSNNLDYGLSNISDIQSKAFNNPNSWFYSCNTATGENRSFLKAWHDKIHGFTGGYYGKTDYTYITYSIDYFSYSAFDPRKFVEDSKIILLRKKYGFSQTGSLNYPIPYTGATQITYR